jgi:hypothetical protein
MARPSYVLKLERAGRHFEEMEAAVGDFLERGNKPYEVREDRTSKPGKLRLWLTLRAEPPDTITLAAGDAIHNARSALEHFVYELSSKRESNPPDTGFPIHSYPESWDRRDRRGRLVSNSGQYLTRLLPDEAQRLIEDWQPWKGHDPLRWPREKLKTLHALDVADKHKKLNLAVAYLGPSPFGTYSPEPMPNVEAVHAGPLQLNTPALMLQLASVPTRSVHPVPMLDVVFSEGVELASKVITEVGDLILAVGIILRELEGFLG